jgi:mRNA interferase RelE/StbE
MAWNVELSDKVKKTLKELDAPVRKRILNFLNDHIRTAANPRAIGEALHGSELGTFWKYHVGDYRLICQIEDQTITVTVIKIGHRREVYRQQ